MKFPSVLVAATLFLLAQFLPPAVGQSVGTGTGPMYPLVVNTSLPLSTQLAGIGLSVLPSSNRLLDLDGDGHLDALSLFQGCSTWHGNGDGSFGPATVFPAGAYPQLGELADMNGDGILDAVFPDPGTFSPPAQPGSVHVLPGNADGTFGPLQTTTIEGEPLALDTGDLDGDGWTDVLVIVQGPAWYSDVWLLKGIGGGGLGPPVVVISSVVAAIEIDIGDIDGDRNLDAVVVHEDTNLDYCIEGTYGSERITRWRGNGDGSFLEMVPYMCTSESTRQLDLVDVNGDGTLDLLLQLITGTAFVSNPGSGVFGPEALIPGASSSVLLIEPGGDLLDFGGSLSAFDGDGEPDLITSGSLSSLVIKVLPGLGGGAFDSPIAVSDVVAGPLDLGDVDEDGRLDLAASTPGSIRYNVVLRGFGDGTFEGPRSYSLGGVFIEDAYGQKTVADFNADGAPDFAFYTIYPDGVYVVLSDGTTGYGTPDEYPQPGAYPDGMVSGDFNGDGNLDIAIGPGGEYILPGIGGGKFGVPIAGPILPGELAAAGDFDGDSLSDLLTVELGEVRMLRASGGFTFLPAVTISHDPDVYDAAAADLDADGLEDVVFSSYGPAPLLVRLALGQGSFAPPILLPFSGASNQLTFGDLDGNGALDILVTVNNESLYEDGEITFLLGSGTGTFVQAGSVTALGVVRNVAIADVHRDGLPDVLAGTSLGFGSNLPAFSTLMVFRALADGTFDAPRFYGLYTTPRMMAVSDANLDGWPDLYSAGDSEISVSLHQWGPWKDMGHGLSGVAGKPRLQGTGTLLPSGRVGLDLTQAAPAVPCALVIGFGEALLPFKGGVLVPNLDILIPGLVSGIDGKLVLESLWPPGIPASAKLYFQMWIADGAAAHGYAASNAVRATVP